MTAEDRTWRVANYNDHHDCDSESCLPKEESDRRNNMTSIPALWKSRKRKHVEESETKSNKRHKRNEPSDEFEGE
jgi:hypothetical protein